MNSLNTSKNDRLRTVFCILFPWRILIIYITIIIINGNGAPSKMLTMLSYSYCQHLTTYYMQMEDDVYTIPNYLDVVKDYISEMRIQ